MRWDEMRWDEMRWDEMGWDGMWWDGMGWDEMRWGEIISLPQHRKCDTTLLTHHNTFVAGYLF